MKVERVDIATLIEDPSNVRMHPDRNLEATKGSLTRFGQQKPIVVGSDNVVIAGNGTLRAARALGWAEISVVRSQLTGAEAIAYAIADNRTAELANWDLVGLEGSLDALLKNGVSADQLGFSSEDMLAMFGARSWEQIQPMSAGDLQAAGITGQRLTEKITVVFHDLTLRAEGKQRIEQMITELGWSDRVEVVG